VKEVIFINDASTDNTQEVLEELSFNDKRVKWKTLEFNSKQAAAKNVGLELVSTDYVYFGDDDSYLIDGMLERMLELYQTGRYSLVAARAVYLIEEGSGEYYKKDFDFLSDIRTLETNFALDIKEPRESVLAPACHIISTEIAKKVRFDEAYKGNGFREETDFVVRVNNFTGLFPIICSDCTQINLPRSCSTGGAHAFSNLSYDFYKLRNTVRFLIKNRKILYDSSQNRTNFCLVMKGVLMQIIKQRASSIKRLISFD
tara:strand:+ start:9132 stop:9905 length:774 start_codon:yes stop_codon:yes gene_type:complete